MDPGNKLHVQYGVFHAAEVATGDVDPVYPVLKAIAREQDWDQEKILTAIFTHVAYYDLGSALTALSSSWSFRNMPDKLPCATERRAHRMPVKLRAHLDNLAGHREMFGSLKAWLWEFVVPGDPVHSWSRVSRYALMRVVGNGRWSAYKTAEMLKEVAGWPLAAPDMGHAYSSGPRQGLELLYPELRKLSGRNDEEAVRLLDRVSERHAEQYRAPLEQCETTLCDFHSLAEGRYYVGHDIDQMQDQLGSAPDGPLIAAAWRARRRVFSNSYRGEANGRHGIDRERCKAFRDTGRILLREGS